MRQAFSFPRKVSLAPKLHSGITQELASDESLGCPERATGWRTPTNPAGDRDAGGDNGPVRTFDRKFGDDFLRGTHPSRLRDAPVESSVPEVAEAASG
jgi:hypothetical protein